MLNATSANIKTNSKKSVFNTKPGILQLPSINKTFEYNNQKIGKSNTSLKVSFKTKVQQLTKNMDYQDMSEGQINKQYKKLRNLLKELNDDIAQLLQKNQIGMIKSSPKQSEVKDVLEIRNKQVENNTKMLQFYKIQLSKLLKRQQEVGQQSKNSLQVQILKINEKIQLTRTEIRELIKNNNKRGNNIVDADSIVKQMKKLTDQKVLLEQKRNKLLLTHNKLIQQIKLYTSKNNGLSEQSIKAQKIIKQLDQKQQQQKEDKKLQMQHLQKRLYIENLKKKIEGLNSNMQQRYLNKLRQLQGLNNKIKQQNDKLSQIDTQLMNSRSILKQIQQKYNDQYEEQETEKQNKTEQMSKQNSKQQASSKVQTVENKKHKLLKRLGNNSNIDE